MGQSFFRIGLLASAQKGYGLYLVENGGAEQDPEEWWQAMCQSSVITARPVQRSSRYSFTSSHLSVRAKLSGS